MYISIYGKTPFSYGVLPRSNGGADTMCRNFGHHMYCYTRICSECCCRCPLCVRVIGGFIILLSAKFIVVFSI